MANFEINQLLDSLITLLNRDISHAETNLTDEYNQGIRDQAQEIRDKAQEILNGERGLTWSKEGEY